MERARETLDTLQAIELAEGVESRLRIAGPLLRIFAWLIDLAVIAVALIVVSIVLQISGILLDENVIAGLLTLVWFFLSWWYSVFFEVSSWGATVGKKACGLRVMQPSGAPITWSQAIVRNFLRAVDIHPPFFGLPAMISCLSTKRFQRLGDLAAGTVVVYDSKKDYNHRPARVGPPPLREQRPHVALRPDEARAIVTFHERAADWSDARRCEMADHVHELTGKNGMEGVYALNAMAHWLQGKK